MDESKIRQDLSDRMKAEAVGLGLCRQWTQEWADGTTKDEMVEKFVRGLDFCIKHDWPSPEVMQRDFGDVMHKYGVWANEPVCVKNTPTVVLNGACQCDAVYDGCASGDIYVRHTSTLNLRIGFLAKAFVTMRDQSRVSIEAEEGTTVCVYQYGGEIMSLKGNVKVRDKRRLT